MIIPEDIIKARLTSRIREISMDPDLEFIANLFSDNEAGAEDDVGYIDELRGITDDVKACWRKDPPIVRHALNWIEIAESPGIYIEMGNEVIDGSIGQNRTRKNGDGGIWTIIEDEVNNPALMIWLVHANKTYVRYLYFITRAMIQSDWIWYARKGVLMSNIRGGNPERAMMAGIPVFARQITIKIDYVTRVTQFDRAIIGRDLTAEYQEGTE